MYYYLYQITNKLNGKIYIGVHKTINLDDGYMGSGRAISSAIRKYGLENFEKTILEIFEDSESMYNREKEIVTEEFLSRRDVYNIKQGGLGGFDHINRDKDENYLKTRSVNGKTYNFKTRNDPRFAPRYGKDNYVYRVKTKTNFALNPELQKRAIENALSPKSREKRIASFKEIGHSQGEKNSQFGTMWITNGSQNKKIKKHQTLPDGWKIGRVNGNKKSSTKKI